MFLSSSAAAIIGGILSLICCRKEKLAQAVGLGGTAAAVAIAAYAVLSNNHNADALSLFFTLPVMLIGMMAAIHALSYVPGHGKTGVFWGFFDLTLGVMLALPHLQNFLSFLIAWELMGAVSFVLVMFRYKEYSMSKVTWVYLLACEAGGLLLMLFYALGGTLHAVNTLVFALGLAGFGIKGGFLWLPEAHPEAPAPVSALMSASMLNLSLYGMLRFVFVPENYAVAGWVLLSFGLLGSFGGILVGCAQDNLKKLLAYSSVENIGIISIALGLGFLGIHYRHPAVSVAGFAGALLHIINHTLIKGALFLGSGQILRSTGTLSIDVLGGLIKRLPLSGVLFTGNSMALSGLPPFNAFAGELIIYAGCFAAITDANPALRMIGIAAALILALTGACAVAAFTKAAAGTFLGEPRSVNAADAKPESPWMTTPVLILSMLSLFIVFIYPVLLPLIFKTVQHICPYELTPFFCEILAKAAWGAAIFYALLAVLFFVRCYLLKRGRNNHTGVTWDCGYAYPTAKMEYTGSGIIQAFAGMFNGILRPGTVEKSPEGIFPGKSSFSRETPDIIERYLYNPLFKLFGRAADLVHRLQSGFLHFYILVMLLMLAILLVWAFLSGGVK